MAAFVDLYTEGDSFLHRLDPRVKILAVMLLSVIALMLAELVELLLFLGFIFLLLLSSRVSLRKSAFSLKFIGRVMVMIVVLWPLFDPSGTPVIVSFGPLKVTEPGVWRGIMAAVRIGCLATVWYILMFTTSQRDLVRALVKMGLRFDYGLALSISLRFIPTFGAIVESITDAQRARGLELDKGAILKRSRNYVAVLVPTIATALRTSNTLSLALQSRAYGARRDRTYLRDFRMTAADGVAVVAVIALFSVTVITKYGLGWSI